MSSMDNLMEVPEPSHQYSENSSDTSDKEDPFADAGSSYVPDSEGESAASDDSDDNQGEQIENTGVVEIGRKRKRGKKNKIKDKSKWQRNVRKMSKNSGKEYASVTEKTVPCKNIDLSNCVCIRDCHKLVSLEHRRKLLFDSYYGLQNFNLQTAHLCGLKKNCSKIGNNQASRRGCTRHYYLVSEHGVEVPVCKSFFKKVYQVSDGRLSRVLNGKQLLSTPPIDKRGNKAFYNKTKPELYEQVVNFIDKFPKYQSHYSRQKNPNKKYLAPTLNITILYELYKKEVKDHQVSKRVFRDIFKKEFNLSFHAPTSDSCKTCDNLEQRIKYEDVKRNLELERTLHKKKAAAARNSMKADADFGKVKENDCTVIAFNLMSTLPTPHLSTGVCFYKRQLWRYCFGINNLSTEDSFMYIWEESIASKGPAEIGSCLLHFFKNFVKTSKVIMYSDQCGGQNRNIKVAVLCNYVIESNLTTIRCIDHKFLVSGHTYMACDRDFGVIEKAKKQYGDIFLPKDWVRVITKARKRNPFKIVQLQKFDFFSTMPLEKNIVNRKTTESGSSVRWMNMQWLRYKAPNNYEIQFKETINNEFQFEKVNIKKRTTTKIGELPLLYPTGRKIEQKKFTNLQELLPFIPPVCHEFYNSLQISGQEVARPNEEKDLLELYNAEEFDQSANESNT